MPPVRVSRSHSFSADAVFAALRESPDEPLRSPYAASVIAVLLEASAKLVVVARAAAPLYPQGVPFRRGIVPVRCCALRTV